MLRKLRVTMAVMFFALITLLLLDFTGTLHHWLGWMARIQFLPAVLALNAVVIICLVVAALIFGRMYCSVICPLGVMQDVISWISGKRKGKRNRFSYSPAMNWLRWVMLAVLVVALVLGMGSIAALIAPYSSYGRIVTNLFQPIYIWCNNALAAVAEHYESYAVYNKEVWLRSLPTLIVAAVTFAVIAVLAWRHGRTYCNTICPVGTVLGQISRLSWLKIHFEADKCRNCGMCAKSCKAACIDVENHKVDPTRCIVCGDCLDRCKFDALHYGHPKSQPKPEAEETPDNARRAVLLGSAIVAADVVLAQVGKKLDGGLAVVEYKTQPTRTTPITPPGSRSARNMAAHCTACQLCVQQCPNDVLRPSSGLATLMQPTLSFERGFCRPECNRCSSVCPTGAILPIEIDEKSAIQIGHAVYLKQNCVIFTDEVSCGNCARHCPSGAIEMVPDDPNDDTSPMRPAVNKDKCIGCGACEYVCPARPFSAIYVEGHLQHNTI